MKNKINNMKIKNWKLFINENISINNIISELDKLGIDYELSENEYKPFKVIYKPINKSDDFYKKFDKLIYLNNLESVVK